MEHMMELFDAADANHDGMLTKEELKAAIQSQHSAERGRPGGPGPQGEPRSRGERDRGPGQRAERGPGEPGERGPGGRPPRDEQGRPGRGPGGDGAHGPDGPGGPGGPGGPPPRPGEILPGFVIESLGLSEEQREKLVALQKSVDEQLASILTDEQKEQMESHRPPQHGGEHAEGRGGARNANRPQRPN